MSTKRWPLALSIGLNVILTWALVVSCNTHVEVPVDNNTDIIKTVAHINLSKNNQLERIYVDYANDVAYYRYIGQRDIIRVGDTVLLPNNTEAVVTKTDIYGFYVKSDSMLFDGDSGKAVTNSYGNQLGYVSEILSTGEVYCIWS